MIIFLAIFIVIFYNKTNAPDNIQHLSSLSLNEINFIKISRADDEDIIFKKEADDTWYMTQPYQLKAHQFRIKTLLNLTQTPINKIYDIKDLDLRQYALDAPRARITFNKTQIHFGKTNPLSDMRYFLAEGKMSLIADQTYPLVSAQASSFIDLKLIPDNYPITKIQTPAINIFQSNDTTWSNSQNVTGKNTLNSDQIQTLLQHWKSAQAFAVHKYLPRKHLGKIEINSHTKILIFHITDDDPWLILAFPDLGIEYHLDASQKDLLFGIMPADKIDA